MFARATDSNGQVAESKRAVVHVSAAAAPYVVLTAPTSGQTFTNPASITLSADAGAASGATVTKVDFYDGSTIVGTANAPPYTVQWNQPPGGTHYIMAVVTDSRFQFAQTPPVSISIVRDQLAVTVDAGIDGSTVSDTNLLVTGTLQAPANSAVSIGNQVGTVTFDGRFFINSVPLAAGPNTLVVTLSTQDGPSTSQTIVVTRDSAPGITLSVSKTSGIAPFDTVFSVLGAEGPTPRSVEFDINGDGVADLTTDAASASNVTISIGIPGYNRATVKVKDQDGIVLYSTTRILYAYSGASQFSFLSGIYTKMLDRLRTLDVNAALTAVTENAQPKYSAVFSDLGPDLPAAVDQLGALAAGSFGDSVADLSLIRQVGAQKFGFHVQMLRGADGIWRIDGM